MFKNVLQGLSMDLAISNILLDLVKNDLPTLIYRKERGDMIELYKHLHIYDKETLSCKFNLRSRTSRKHNFQLMENIPQHNSFYYRNARIWNNLPKDVVNVKTVDNFKAKLDEAWQNKPTKYDPLSTNES